MMFQNGDEIAISSNGDYVPSKYVRDRPIGVVINDPSVEGQTLISVYPGEQKRCGGPEVTIASGYKSPAVDDPKLKKTPQFERVAKERAASRGWVGKPCAQLKALDTLLGPLDDRDKGTSILLEGERGVILTIGPLVPGDPKMVMRLRRERDDAYFRFALVGSAHLKLVTEVDPPNNLENNDVVKGELVANWSPTKGDRVEVRFNMPQPHWAKGIIDRHLPASREWVVFLGGSATAVRVSDQDVALGNVRKQV